MVTRKRKYRKGAMTVLEAVTKYTSMSNKELAELTGASMKSIYRARWQIRQDAKAAPEQLDLFENTEAIEAPIQKPTKKEPEVAPPSLRSLFKPNNVREQLDDSALEDLRIAAELLNRVLRKLK